MRSRTRMIIVATALLVMAPACLPQWGSSRYDSGNSANNVSETVLGKATVGTVGTEWQTALTAGDAFTFTPVVGADTLVATVYRADTSGQLEAFSASGQGCSGLPLTCAPRWVATSPGPFLQPVIVGGVVYAITGGLLRAYDAAGVQGCSGSPTVCEPLWSGSSQASGLSVEGTLIVATDLPGKKVAAYSTDASGCSGSPRQCAPTITWALTPSCTSSGGPPFGGVTCQPRDFVVKDARIYVTLDTVSVSCSPTFGCSTPIETGGLLALDATTPGPPLWVQKGTSASDLFGPSILAPAVVGDEIYYSMKGLTSDAMGNSIDSVITFGLDGSQRRRHQIVPFIGFAIGADSVFTANFAEVVQTDADPTSPRDVVRRFTDGLDPTGAGRPLTAPALANGLLYQGWGHVLHAFDISGASGCTAGTPAVCQPIWSIDLGTDVRRPIVSNGRIFVETGDGRLISLAGGTV